VNIYKVITDGSYNDQTGLIGLGIVLIEPHKVQTEEWITHSLCVEGRYEEYASNGALVAEFTAAILAFRLIPKDAEFKSFTDNDSVIAALERNKRKNRLLENLLLNERDQRKFISVHKLNDSPVKKNFSPRMKKAHDLAKGPVSKGIHVLNRYDLRSLLSQPGFKL
jgi:ribonuclease HI